MSLSKARHWVFDMDGTLTLAVHDFEAIKRELQIPLEQDILHHLAALPDAESKAKHAWLLEHERQLALNAQPAPGAVELLGELSERGVQLGILTRNAHELALLTLQAIGVGDYFASADVIGRGEALPKPDPDGLLRLARRWQVRPSQLVMVGDYHFDLQCARAAGAYSVLVNLPANPWPELVDHYALDCRALLNQLNASAE
ncbi:HAD family hydrolase [Pseudomonas sp. NPDC078700]|uniref:HAD family hydrolase n=1 Tax=Pseudomonas sp. NPDC078700 TaxID=3364424 RepID=UPI0037CA76A5